MPKKIERGGSWFNFLTHHKTIISLDLDIFIFDRGDHTRA